MPSHLEHSDRRQFLKGGVLASVAAWAVGAMRSVSGQTPASEARQKDILAYGQPSQFDNTIRRAPGGRSAFSDTALMTPLQDLDGIITPSGLHFLMDHTDGFPLIDPQQHRLLIQGMVDRPLVFTMDELKRLPSVSGIYFLECNANGRPLRTPHKESVQMVHGKTSCSEWTGVLVSTLLKEAGIQKGASWLVAEGSETKRYTMSIPLEKAMDDILVAYSQNGEPVRPQQGYPLRLVIPGWEAIRSVKWLRQLKVTDEAVMAEQESGNNADITPDGKAHWFRFEQGPKSVITRPSGGQRLPNPGFYEITGLAWTGGGAVRRVEVSTDDGRTWKDAELQAPVLRFAHTRFRFPWNWNGEEVVLQSRCTDERGEVQPTIAQLSKVMGVTPDYFFRADHFNGIQPWKVNRDGSVQNGLVV